MQNPFKLILILNSHFKMLGIGSISGILLAVNRNKPDLDFTGTEGNDFCLEALPKNLVYLRNITSDITLFYQIFLERSYSFNYHVNAENTTD